MTTPRKDSTPQVLKIGRKSFTVKEKIGQGMFGEVFRGVSEDGRAVAIKKFDLATQRMSFDADLEQKFSGYVNPIRTSIQNLERRSTVETNLLPELTKEKEKLAFAESRLSQARADFERQEQDRLREIQHESTMLTLAGESVADLERVLVDPNNPKVANYVVAMNLVSGQSLAEMLGYKNIKPGQKLPPNPLTPEQLVDITHQLGERLQELQDRSVILRDISIHNIMFDKVTRTLKLVDYGDALEAKAGVAYGQAVGSEPNMSPEVLEQLHYTNKEPKEVKYSEATTVYAYGALLAKLFDLADTVNSPEFKKAEKSPFKVIALRSPSTEKSKIGDLTVRTTMLELLREMTQEQPSARITLASAMAQLKQIMLAYHPSEAVVLQQVDSAQLDKDDQFKTYLVNSVTAQSSQSNNIAATEAQIIPLSSQAKTQKETVDIKEQVQRRLT